MEKPRKPATTLARSGEAPGFAVRRVAADMLDSVLRRHRPLDELLDSTNEFVSLAERDRALVRVLVATVLRRLGTLRDLLGLFLDRGLPAQVPRVEIALLIGAPIGLRQPDGNVDGSMIGYIEKKNLRRADEQRGLDPRHLRGQAAIKEQPEEIAQRAEPAQHRGDQNAHQCPVALRERCEFIC